MFQLVRGNLLQCQAEALVNTVNAQGIMGKGVALQFRHAFPEMYKAYKKACQDGNVQPGKMFIYKVSSSKNPQYIINFPTKRNWRSKSRMEDIEIGLKALVADVQKLGIHSVAVPPLGCGLGGLSWPAVRQRMESTFQELPDVDWLVYEPVDPLPNAIACQPSRPKMTRGRAVLVELIRRYLVPGFCYEITLLEIQKLIYFIMEAGEGLSNVVFEKGYYGPYADVLRHVFEKLEGHFITGYVAGGNKPESPITLLPNIAEEAEWFLKDYEDAKQRFVRVSDLIVGFETSFGMELLATVHWVVTRECSADARDPIEAYEKVKAWNTRKAALMNKEHVAIAWQRLQDHGWFCNT
jgi:O-acetyl-ADP-ribose deacetylase (regulator of RNase III)